MVRPDSSINKQVATDLRHKDDAIYDGHISDPCDPCLNEGTTYVEQEVYFVYTDDGYAVDVQRTMDAIEHKLRNISTSNSHNW